MQHLAPGIKIPDNWFFRPKQYLEGFTLETNYNFDAINALYHKHVPPEHSTITPAYLLSHIMDARADLTFSAAHRADLLTNPIFSDILDLKFSSILEKTKLNLKEIEVFRHAHLDAGGVSGAIASGERSLKEFLDVLDLRDKAKFKDWVKQLPCDGKLANEYVRAITAETWIAKLPMKRFRFAFFYIAGKLTELIPKPFNYMVEFGLSAADAFLVDRIIKGWRPDQFVAKLNEFIKPRHLMHDLPHQHQKALAETTTAVDKRPTCKVGPSGLFGSEESRWIFRHWRETWAFRQFRRVRNVGIYPLEYERSQTMVGQRKR